MVARSHTSFFGLLCVWDSEYCLSRTSRRSIEQLKVPQGEAEGDTEESEGDIKETEGDIEETEGNSEEAEGDIEEAEGDSDITLQKLKYEW